MNSFFFTSNEIFILILLIISLVLPLNLINKNFKLSIAHPLIMHNIFMFYYAVFIPVIQVVFNQTNNRGFDFREQYILGWQGALLSVISVFIGYSLKHKVKKGSKYCNLNYESLWSIGLSINIIGILSFMLIMGFDLSNLNPFAGESQSIDFLAYRGGFKNYFLYTQDFLVSGSLLMFASSYTTKKNFPITLLSVLMSATLYLNQGFRYRLLFLFLSLIIFLLYKEEKLNARRSIIIGLFAIIFGSLSMTLIGAIRNYDQGLDLAKINIESNVILNIVKTGESTVFSTTSGIINLIPKTLPFENFYPIFKTIIHPLPSAFFDKDAGDYAFKILDGVFGFKDIYKGAAYLNFGEFYLMFGWFGIFIFNFLLGYLFKKLWIWINIHREEPLAIIIYILNVNYIFMVISRGYLPQIAHLYFFSLFPVYAIYFYKLKRKLTN